MSLACKPWYPLVKRKTKTKLKTSQNHIFFMIQVRIEKGVSLKKISHEGRHINTLHQIY